MAMVIAGFIVSPVLGRNGMDALRRSCSLHVVNDCDFKNTVFDTLSTLPQDKRDPCKGKCRDYNGPCCVILVG